ncbi:GHMP kinase [Aurantibacter crassamenti]|uniref:GYDIA family GHMP kinase n=1 Tax=Aurantibacter crassamenti TaxID=1837375 RepID=UPI00193A9417|nr:GYDIA family GHMP kinase [Aurantibacter crassamenti]MBM1104692.1 GHMP kinase [Aurantibacter crassamenti]
MKSFYSNGKLLLTGEYAVLDGALALAIPTKHGQSLKVIENNTSQLIWKSYDEKGTLWLEATYSLPTLSKLNSSDTDLSNKLLQILKEAQVLNPDFLTDLKGCTVETNLDFPRNWGLGTSSTLINNIAQWANVNAFDLLKNSFGGSGYDIACAQNDYPILYQIKEGIPSVQRTSFKKEFENNLYFVHLNKKQNSGNEIARYSNQKIDKKELVKKVSKITNQLIKCDSLQQFEILLNQHESILATALNNQTIKEILFDDFNGSIKSLGAWGGDFILAIGDQNTPVYFKKKGFTTVIPFNKMIL